MDVFFPGFAWFLAGFPLIFLVWEEQNQAINKQGEAAALSQQHPGILGRFVQHLHHHHHHHHIITIIITIIPTPRSCFQPGNNGQPLTRAFLSMLGKHPLLPNNGTIYPEQQARSCRQIKRL